MINLSLRRLWTIYKQTARDHGAGRRELAVAHDAFYSEASAVLMMLDHMAESGDLGEVNRTVGRFGKQIRAIRRQPRRRH